MEFLCLTPYAPRFPFEMWMLPKRHVANFEESQRLNSNFWPRSSQRHSVGKTRPWPGPHTTFVLHSSPLQERTGEFYHWHLEIIPKVTQVPGFEIGGPDFESPRRSGRVGQALREARSLA